MNSSSINGKESLLKLYNQFIELIKSEFPKVKFSHTPTQNRTNPYLPNEPGNKRWMQIDIKEKYLSIVMDHRLGDIDRNDFTALGLQNSLRGRLSRIDLNKNQDNVTMAIYPDKPFDFYTPEFVAFLHKHYASYERRIEKFR